MVGNYGPYLGILNNSHLLNALLYDRSCSNEIYMYSVTQFSSLSHEIDIVALKDHLP